MDHIPVTDYEDCPPEQNKETEQSADLSEDTDCDGSSLPEDSPVVQIQPATPQKMQLFVVVLVFSF